VERMPPGMEGEMVQSWGLGKRANCETERDTNCDSDALVKTDLAACGCIQLD
jgi:hypothetical protein